MIKIQITDSEGKIHHHKGEHAFIAVGEKDSYSGFVHGSNIRIAEIIGEIILEHMQLFRQIQAVLDIIQKNK